MSMYTSQKPTSETVSDAKARAKEERARCASEHLSVSAMYAFISAFDDWREARVQFKEDAALLQMAFVMRDALERAWEKAIEAGAEGVE